MISPIKAATPIDTQPPSSTFTALAEKKPRSMMPKTSVERERAGQRPFPEPAHDDEQQDRGHQHLAGDRDAVGGGERARFAEADDQAA